MPAGPVAASGSAPDSPRRGVVPGDQPDGMPALQPPETIRKRADFLAANGGFRVSCPAFILLIQPRAPDRTDPAPEIKRIGITATRKLGGAVARNRIKRRFRALAREVLPEQGIAGADHVLIGREAGLTRDFAVMRADLEQALDRVRSGKASRDRGPRRGGRPGKKR